MTSISSNTAALSLLQQGSVLPGAEGQKNATDAILDIVAGQLSSSKKTAAATGAPAAAVPQATVTTSPREVGGSVSGEISRGQLSGMAAGGQVALMPNREVGAIGSVNGGTPADDGGDNAIRFATALAVKVDDLNSRFHLLKVPTREEWNKQVVEAEQYNISKGADPARVRQVAEAQMSDKGYQSTVSSYNMTNESFTSELGHAYVVDSVSLLQGWLSGGFNADTKISYNEKGEAKLEAFEFSYGNGQKISYHDDGSMSVTKADGTTAELDYRAVRVTGGNLDGRLWGEK